MHSKCRASFLLHENYHSLNILFEYLTTLSCFNNSESGMFFLSLQVNMEFQRSDAMLMEILQDRKTITGFLDAVFGFLRRK